MLLVWSFIRAHWRPFAVLAALLIAFGAGFGSARSTMKPGVITVTKTVTVEKVVEAKAKQVEKRVVVYRDRIIKPDGTRIEHEVERSQTDAKSTSTRAAEKTAAAESTQIIKPSNPPDWRVGALVGLNWQGIHWSPLSIGLDALTYGVFVDRRILGPFSVGLWVTNSGKTFAPALGLQVSMEF
jgi:hypothetical protein